MIFQFVQREVQPCEETLRIDDRLRIIAEYPRHFRGALQVPLGISRQQEPGIATFTRWRIAATISASGRRTTS